MSLGNTPGSQRRLFNLPKNRKQGFRLALAATCLALVVVVLGAFTRLVDAGLGCPDWPGCYGHVLWPDSAAEIAVAETRFPDAPVATDKTWPEMVHRYFAGTLGLFIAALALLAWRQRETRGFPFRLPMFLLFLVVWQALFGMWTVTLKLWPQVVTAHLLGGISTLSLLWLLTVRLDDQRWQVPAAVWQGLFRLKPMLIGAVIVVFLQVALGGWISSNYAAFACADFPTCNGTWWPTTDFSTGFNVLQGIGPNYLGGLMTSEARVAIHLTHRIGALVVSVYLLALCIALLMVPYGKARRMAFIVAAALALQVGLGIGNVLFQVPLVVAVAHNAGGALLLMTLVTLGIKLWTAERLPVEEDESSINWNKVSR